MTTDYINCNNCINHDRINKNCLLKQEKVEIYDNCIDFNENIGIEQLKTEELKPKENIIKNFSAFTPYDSVQAFYEIQPFFYDKNKIFWFWNKKSYCYEIVDEIDLVNNLEIDLQLQGQTFGSKLKGEYIECFKRIGRLNQPTEPAKEWVQFKNKIFNIKTQELKEVNHKQFFTNPINWKIGINSETPIMDKLFEEWVGKEWVSTLYELLSYSCYRSYPIQLLFCLFGNGRNGKSQFLKILDKFVEAKNATSTELELIISNRFETFKLYKKLVCLIGETNFGIFNNTGLFKKITGGDKMGFEKKNKDPFDDYNYAKMIIASNSLPSSQDTSDGFYRRWLIIDFPNEFEDTGKEVWEDVPEQEYKNLAKKVTKILPDLLKKGMFTNQGSIEDRKKKYIEASNPFSIFIDEKCEKNDKNFESYNKLYIEYIHYLQINKKRKVNRKEFRSSIEDEGFYVDRTTKNIDGEYISSNWVTGIKLKNNVNNVNNVSNPTQEPHKESEWEVLHNLHNLHNSDFLIEILRQNDTGKGVTEYNLTSLFKGNLQKTIEELKTKGLIFEIKPGVIKLI